MRIPAPPETNRNVLILRIKAFINARLDDPGLSSSRIARAHNISPRYLQRLFEVDGTTATNWNRGQRLEHYRNDLLDPRFVNTSIGTIAARWGLIDLSYFSRLLKIAYGTTPSGCRSQTSLTAPVTTPRQPEEHHG